jgi:hypothetical protein
MLASKNAKKNLLHNKMLHHGKNMLTAAKTK